MWFVLSFSPLGEKWGVLFCFGVSFSHIHHHVILFLLLANVSPAFVLGETNFPWKWYSSWEDPLKQITFIIPHFPATLVSAAPPRQQAIILKSCQKLAHSGGMALQCWKPPSWSNIFLWEFTMDVITQDTHHGSVPWLLMNRLNLEKSSPSTPTASVVALTLLHLPHIRHFQCCISSGVKVIPTLFISVTGTLTFSNTDRHWNGLWSNYWPLGKEREEEALLGCLCFFMTFYIF